VISPREILLAFLLPALLCVLLGALAARAREGFPRRFVDALAVAIPYLLASYAISGHVPILAFSASAAQVVPLLILPLALTSALIPAAAPILATLGLFGLLFSRLGAPPVWPERVAAVLAFGLCWSASRSPAQARPAWRSTLALGTFAGTVALACLCGRVASLSLTAAGLGAAIGASLLVALRKPAWSLGPHGFDVAVFALGGSLAGAVYLGELDPWAALLLLVALVANRLPAFRLAFGAQLALSALALWLAWPADGLAP
jgi:hypothetical protein